MELGPDVELLPELRLWYLRDLRAGGDRILRLGPFLVFGGEGENWTRFGCVTDFDK